MKSLPGYPEALKAARYLESRWRQRPRVGIILGSGLGDVVNRVQNARKAARSLKLKCLEGVYAGLLGPNYETPAEIRALKRLGAGAVGMSTVAEVIAARQMGARVLTVATISNRAAGLSRRLLNHEE